MFTNFYDVGKGLEGNDQTALKLKIMKKSLHDTRLVYKRTMIGRHHNILSYRLEKT